MAKLKYKDKDGNWHVVAGGGVGGKVTVDHKVSDSSTNAVSSKAVKTYIDRLYPSDFNNDFNEEFFI